MSLLLAAVAGGPLLAFGLAQFSPARRAGDVPEAVTYVRQQLNLEPVLAAEERVRAQPNNPEMRLQLAEACARGGDTIGAVLALYPLVGASAPPDVLIRYADYCIDARWPNQAETALAHLQSAPAGIRLRLADALVRRGEAGRAIKLLTSIEKDSLQPEEWLTGALVWYFCRRPERAVAWAQKGASARPEDPAAQVALARSLVAASRPAEALRALPQPAPGSVDASLVEFWRARIQLRLQDPAARRAGMETLAKVAEKDTEHGAAAFEAGRAYLAQGEPGKAAPLLARAVHAGYQAVLGFELLAKALRAQGREAEAAWSQGRSHAIRGHGSRAQAAFRKSLEHDPKRMVSYLDLANARAMSGDLPNALEVLARAEKQLPNNLDTAVLRAGVLGRMQRVKEAAQELERAAGLDPTRAVQPLRDLGILHHDTNQFEQAIPVLERAVQADDANPQVHLYLGLCYGGQTEDRARAEKAVYHLVRAGTLQFDYFYPWTRAGAVLQKMGHLSEAAACFRRAALADSETDGPYLSLAQVLQQQRLLAERKPVLDRYNETRDLELKRTRLENQVTEHPDDVEAHYSLGNILLRKGSHGKAFTRLVTAASLRPEWKPAQERFADVCALLGYDDLLQEAERAARNARH